METNKNQGNNNGYIEGFEGQLLHPSFDIKDKVLILGFRYTAKDRKEKEVFLAAKAEVIKIVLGDVVEFDGNRYFLEKNGRKLIRIEKRWSLQGLNRFRKEYEGGKPLPKPKEIYTALEEDLKRYVELEEEIDYSLVTAWIIGTYFFPIFSAYPFLHIKAPKRSGKSQCLNFLERICFNAVKGRPSLAALGDTIDSLRGVCLIDQADSLKRRGNEDLVDILADSYKKEGGKRRIIDFGGRRERRVLEFETYSPKVFASIGELPEDLKDRCLIIPLIRSQNNFPDPNEENEGWEEKRGSLYALLIDNYTLVKSTYDVHKVQYRTEQEIVGRELELWLPLETMFIFVGAQDEIQAAKKRFKHLYGYTEYEPSELEQEVVKTIFNQFQDETEIILSPKQIMEKIDYDLFPSGKSLKQEAAIVGWIIKKFNLSSEKKPKTSKGVSYLFKKEKIEIVYNSYFGAPISSEDEPTSPTPTPEIDSN